MNIERILGNERIPFQWKMEILFETFYERMSNNFDDLGKSEVTKYRENWQYSRNFGVTLVIFETNQFSVLIWDIIDVVTLKTS